MASLHENLKSEKPALKISEMVAEIADKELDGIIAEEFSAALASQGFILEKKAVKEEDEDEGEEESEESDEGESEESDD